MSDPSGNFTPNAGSHSVTDFERELQVHAERVYGLALRLSRNKTDGEDLAQETFIRAYRKRDQFRGDADMGTWLYRICVNLWKNRVRYEKRRFFWQHVSLDSSPAGEEDPPPLALADPRDRTDGPAHQTETREWLQRALGELPSDQRAILVLRDMEDRSYEEIAELLDLPLGTVKSRLARAREALKEKLKPLWES